MKKEAWIKGLKIAIGSSIAIFIAEILGLSYATSAGIITLLTVQDTRSATWKLTIFRFLSFGVTMLLAALFCGTLGYRALGFGCFLICMLEICYFFQWDGTISVNAVFGTHVFMMEETLNMSFIVNEFILLLIGSLVAVLLNMKMPDREKSIQTDIHKVECAFKNIFSELAKRLHNGEDLIVTKQQIVALDSYLDIALDNAIANRENTRDSHVDFYIQYFMMRKNQCALLFNIDRALRYSEEADFEAKYVAAYLDNLAETMGVRMDVYQQIQKIKNVQESLTKSNFPKSQVQFESRAMLYYGLKELEEFIYEKKRFIEGLDQEQRALYLDTE